MGAELPSQSAIFLCSSGVITHPIMYDGRFMEVSLLRGAERLPLYRLVGSFIPHLPAKWANELLSLSGKRSARSPSSTRIRSRFYGTNYTLFGPKRTSRRRSRAPVIPLVSPRRPKRKPIPFLPSHENRRRNISHDKLDIISRVYSFFAYYFMAALHDVTVICKIISSFFQ